MAAVFMMFLVIPLMVIAFLAWFFTQRAKNKERIALIEKGEDPSKFLNLQDNKFRFTFPWMRLGIIILGFSLALATVSIMDLYIDAPKSIKGPIYASIIGVFVGISIIISHFVQKRIDKK